MSKKDENHIVVHRIVKGENLLETKLKFLTRGEIGFGPLFWVKTNLLERATKEMQQAMMALSSITP